MGWMDAIGPVDGIKGRFGLTPNDISIKSTRVSGVELDLKKLDALYIHNTSAADTGLAGKSGEVVILDLSTMLQVNTIDVVGNPSITNISYSRLENVQYLIVSGNPRLDILDFATVTAQRVVVSGNGPTAKLKLGRGDYSRSAKASKGYGNFPSGVVLSTA
ncbi:hypothetical protein B0T14DRAFT_570804 [Immersiella caudata]|uniref:Uncharacterized protein n=1 Tax=Immersiella caudata TaxID=314043 RepID=A0AA39WAT5_9PEZI|nr:hypothetical protein B0T14DRAFT_570804 [Immersiella caudata]